MACTNCGHTMASIDVGEHRQAWHCSRCGTLKLHSNFSNSPDIVYTPALVDRVRKLHEAMKEAEQPEGLEALRIMGITEACYPEGSH